jgi:hypothetical protein
MEGNNPENRDVDVRAVTKFGLGIGAGVIVVIFLMWFLFDRFAAREMRLSPQPEPMVSSNPRKTPPEPRLQKAPVMDLKEFRAGEDSILNSYAWVDPDKGVVRIPVDRAMELVTKEGLPSRKEGGSQ